jgi:hypothetical protein
VLHVIPPSTGTSFTALLARAHKLPATKEILLWMTPSEAPKALQASECSELLDLMRASCWISAQHQPGKFTLEPAPPEHVQSLGAYMSFGSSFNTHPLQKMQKKRHFLAFLGTGVQFDFCKWPRSMTFEFAHRITYDNHVKQNVQNCSSWLHEFCVY